MELHLSQGDHPDADVVAGAIPNGGLYTDACWGALVGRWAVEVVRHTARLTERGAVETPLDRYSNDLIPEPVDFSIRAWTTMRALRELAAHGLGSFSRSSSVTAEFRLFRQVPLVPVAGLDSLTDTELGVHASTVEQVNARRAVAGLPAVVGPSWLADRLDRARLAPERGAVAPADAAITRLSQAGDAAAAGPQALSL
jgi:hypothetical protein